VNHRFLDLHFRLPSGTDSLEMQLRRLSKEKISRGHVEVTLSLDRAANETFSLNARSLGDILPPSGPQPLSSPSLPILT